MADILYTMAGATDIVFDQHGRPILPISSFDELENLRGVASLHNARLTEAAAATYGEKPVRRKEVVLGLGPKADTIASLYAHLTGRTAVTAQRYVDVDATIMPALVVTTTDQLTADLMNWLYHPDTSGARAPGLIVGVDQATLVLIAKKWAVAAATAGPARLKKPNVFLLPNHNFGRLERPEGILVGGQAHPTAAVAALGSAAPVLSILAGSSGYDVMMGAGTYLCPFVHQRNGSSIAAPPACLELDRCTRLPRLPTRAAAWASGRIFSAEAIKANILVLFSCNILRLADRTISAEINLGADIALKATLGACVTTWREESFNADGSSYHGLLNALFTGHDVGTAVAIFNRSPEAAYFGVRLCVLGDPAYAVPPRKPAIQLPVMAMPPDHAATNEAEGAVMVGYIEMMRAVFRAAPGRRPIDTGGRLQDIGRSLDGFSKLLRQGRVSKQLLAEVSEDLVEFVKRWPWLDELIWPFLGQARACESKRCPACGGEERRVRLYVIDHPQCEWLSIKCSGCNRFSYAPKAMSVVPRFDEIDDGHLTLTGTVRNGAGAVVFVNPNFNDYSVHSTESVPVRYRNVSFSWPAGHNGDLKDRMSLQAQLLPKGPLQVHVILASDGLVGVWSTFARF